MNIKTVTVLGANGTMGCNVAGIFASFGNAKVYLVSRNIESSREAVVRAGKSVRAGAIADNLVAVDYSSLEECVGESDLVFESVAENMAAKMDVWGKVGRFMKPEAIACTGTSGLSINSLAAILPDQLQGRFMGMHFFNPPYAMRLCELIPAEGMEEALIAEVSGYLAGSLQRTVVRCADAPAFLGNRIGFEFINRAMQLAQENADKGGIDYVDAVFGPFTGRAMAPLNTADFVGLDVHKAIVDNVYVNAPRDIAHDAFALPAFCQHLVKEGRLGRKAKGLGGLYRLDRDEAGNKTRMVFDIESGDYRPVRKYDFPFAGAVSEALRVGDYRRAMDVLVNDESYEARLCLSLLAEFVVYSLKTAGDVCDRLGGADDVMATGFNWCPPLAMAEALSTAGDLDAIVRENLRPELREAVSIDELLADVPASGYDFRRYFRASR